MNTKTTAKRGREWEERGGEEPALQLPNPRKGLTVTNRETEMGDLFAIKEGVGET